MNTKSNCIRTEKTDTVLRPYEKCLTLGAETLSDAGYACHFKDRRIRHEFH